MQENIIKGKIIKGIAGFYYVHAADGNVYECKAKGVFRNKKIKPLVGDDVEIEIIDKTALTGNVETLFSRKNELIRPAVANIDQALVVFASLSPEPNINLLSRFLLLMERNDIPTIICFNKSDQIDEMQMKQLTDIVKDSGAQIVVTSVVNNQGIEELKELLIGRTTALAGPSGVGKSSILNAVFPKANSKIGEISEKINRGKHTTRHTEIFHVTDDTYIMDTPGFTSLDYADIEAEDLRLYFNEFAEYEGQCKFNGCVHVNEPGCKVKDALEQDKINHIRYDIYLQMYNEMKGKRKY